MRAKIVLSMVAALTMSLVAPRNASCCDRPCGSAETLILTFAATGVRGGEAFKRMRLLTQLLAAAPEVTFAGFFDTVLAGPQLAVGGDHGLSVMPTFTTLGSLHQTGVALAGRF